jgi:hypothetical protein
MQESEMRTINEKTEQVEAITPEEAAALLACSQGRRHEEAPFFSGQAKLEATASQLDANDEPGE